MGKFDKSNLLGSYPVCPNPVLGLLQYVALFRLNQLSLAHLDSPPQEIVFIFGAPSQKIDTTDSPSFGCRQTPRAPRQAGQCHGSGA